MKDEKFRLLGIDSALETEQEVLIGMIVDDEICAGIVPMLSNVSFRTKMARTVASWIKEYHAEYNKAPRQDIQLLFAQRRKSLDDATSTIIERMLAVLNEKFKNMPDDQRLITYSPDAMIAQASGLFAGNIEADFAERIKRLRQRGMDKEADKLRDVAFPAAIAKLSAGKMEQPFELKTLEDGLKEMDAEPKKVDWVVHRLMTDDGLTLFASRPKIGKSTLIQNLAVQVVRGLAFLGRPTIQGIVFYFQTPEEGNEKFLKAKLRDMGLTREEDQRMIRYYCGAIPDNALLKFEQMVIEYEPRLVIVDSLTGFYNIDNINDNSEMSRRMKPFAAISRRRHCNIALTMHTDKYRGRILGATSIEGGPDTLFYLRALGTKEDKDSGPRLVRSRNRYGDPIDPPMMLDFDKTTGKITAGGTVRDARGRLLWKEIAEYLANGRKADADEIKVVVESDKQNVLQILHLAMEAGKVVCTGTGKKSDPKLYALVPGMAPATPPLRAPQPGPQATPDEKLIEDEEAKRLEEEEDQTAAGLDEEDEEAGKGKGPNTET